MFNNEVVPLPSFDTLKKHSISGLSSGAFMTVQMQIAHSKSFVGAGVIAGGPYRSAETYLDAAPTAPMSCILNSLYIAMTPLTASTAPDVSKLVELTKQTSPIDDLDNLKDQKLYLFTGTKDKVVNQHAVYATKKYYETLGIKPENLKFVHNVPAGHSIITTNPEDSELSANKPPYINKGDYFQSHHILNHIYGDLEKPESNPQGTLVRFDQSQFLNGGNENISMSPIGYAYIPSKVLDNDATALGVHIVMHGCKQGYEYVNFVNGKADSDNQPPYGDRFVTTTGYIEMAEANNILLLFPQVGGKDNNFQQNPDGCWDWWGYSAKDDLSPDYYTQNAPQIKAIHAMLKHFGG